MNQYISAAVIKELREKKKLTQAQLAEMLHVSDKTVSKWETARGLPDITFLEPLAAALGVSVARAAHRQLHRQSKQKQQPHAFLCICLPDLREYRSQRRASHGQLLRRCSSRLGSRAL